MLQYTVVSILVQGSGTYLFSRKRDRSIKMSPLIMFILVAVPLLSCFILTELGNQIIIFDVESTASHVLMTLGIALIDLAVFALYEHMMGLTSRSLDQQAELQRASLEKAHHDEVQSLYNETRTWRHDYRNHLQVIRGFAETDNTEELAKYLSSIDASLDKIDFRIRSGNNLLDAILNTKLTLAEARGIRFDADVKLVPEDMDSIDLTTLVGNLLDNSIEACERMEPAAERFVALELYESQGQLFLSLRNSTGAVKQENGRFFTSKETPNHGIGMQQIDSVVKKYDGFISRKAEDGIFEVLVRLQVHFTAAVH